MSDLVLILQDVDQKNSKVFLLDLCSRSATRIAYLERREAEARAIIVAHRDWIKHEFPDATFTRSDAWLAGTAPQGQGE